MNAEENKAWENRRAEVAEAELLTMRSLIGELREMLEQLREVEAELSLNNRRPGDCVPKEAVEDAAALSDWGDDRPIPEDAAIEEAFPTRSGRHDLYAEAMRLVGAKRTKGALVSLVNWLLHRIDIANP